MDAPIALALMSAAKRIFERKNTFLSFPVVGQIAYKPEDLSFLNGEVSTNLEQLKLSEFCRLVNRIPDGPVWPPGEERYLWNAYEDVMKANVQFAASTRTPEEEQEYQRAFRLLFDVGEDDLRRDTPMVQTYKQYRDAWITAQEKYGIHQVEAEFTDDPQVKANWRLVLEPRLRKESDSIENEWRIKGFREQVEEARRVETAMGSKSPAKAWQAWDKLFDRTIDIVEDTNLQRFVMSGISPSNALQAAEWLKFTLTGADTNKLIAEAPAELRNRLSPNPVDMEIDSISFECTSAAISRPWLATDLFKARFWKFRDPNELLSDGGTPPSGQIPAYVAALVFARRPVIKLKENSTRNQKMFRSLPAAKMLSLGVFNVAATTGQAVLTSAPQVKPKAMMFRAAAAAVPSSRPPAQQAKMRAAFVRLRATRFSRMTARPGSSTGSAAHTAAVRDRRSEAPMATFVAPAHHGASSTATSGSDSTPQPQPQLQAPDDDIYILAFICKRLPRCPDPDPNFRW